MYTSISIKEALEKINNDSDGWFLPKIQRKYVWGSRYEGEKYICKLFDSIIREYPIGGIILWKTNEKIPYRNFLTDYSENITPDVAPQSKWGSVVRSFVYDGQQRLQTLYSCLKFKFNNKVLTYNLLYDLENPDEDQETGFSFQEISNPLEWNYLCLNSIIDKPHSEKSDFKSNFRLKYSNENNYNERLVENNLDKLWDIFVGYNTKSISYFSVMETNDNKVNEIFRRLNTGGIPLSQAELLFSEIKGKYHDFEDELILKSREYYKITSGYKFDEYNILSLLNLYYKGHIRLDIKNYKQKDLSEIVSIWKDTQEGILHFFSDFLYTSFHINNASIISSQGSIFPILIYYMALCQNWKKNKKTLCFNKIPLLKAQQFFIKSRINDWNLQSYIDNFTDIIKEHILKENNTDFPLEKIENYIVEHGNKRKIDINEETFADYHWFSLKILTPSIPFNTKEINTQRFNPEIDHIFPMRLANLDNNINKESYMNDVNVIWNMQPIKGDINNLKSNHHPLDFFKDQIIVNGEKIIGSQFIQSYQFIPPLHDNAWLDYKSFIKYRKTQMINFMKKTYFLDIVQKE